MSQTIQTPEEETQGQGAQAEEKLGSPETRHFGSLLSFRFCPISLQQQEFYCPLQVPGFLLPISRSRSHSRSLFLTIQLLDLEDLGDS